MKNIFDISPSGNVSQEDDSKALNQGRVQVVQLDGLGPTLLFDPILQSAVNQISDRGDHFHPERVFVPKVVLKLSVPLFHHFDI